MGYSGLWRHCQGANLTELVDQNVGMVIVGHQESILLLQSWEEHDWQLVDSLCQGVVG